MTIEDRELYIGDATSLCRLFYILKDEGYAIYGYKKTGETIVFDKLEDFSDYPLNVKTVVKPGYYRVEDGYGFKHGFTSIKNYLIPPRQEIVVFNRGLELIPQPRVDEKVVLFGVKPCDLKALKILDRIMHSGNIFYWSRRNSIDLIIVEECLSPGNTCFCGFTNSGPFVNDGFDLAYANIDGSTIVFKPGGVKGFELINRIGLSKAGDETIVEYRDLMKNAIDKTIANLPSLNVFIDSLRQSVDDRDLWIELSRKCLGCANCNMVCPTCFCLEFTDEFTDEGYVRFVVWNGCLSNSYGKVAGGHHRPLLYMRFRHFILHKFLFYPVQTGFYGCTGCGRCIVWCPMGIDLRDIVKTISKKGGSVD